MTKEEVQKKVSKEEKLQKALRDNLLRRKSATKIKDCSRKKEKSD